MRMPSLSAIGEALWGKAPEQPGARRVGQSDWMGEGKPACRRRYRRPSQIPDATQEVTGYLIPSLMNAGEEDLGVELARWEASVQKPDGSFAAPDGVPYTFDTAQVDSRLSRRAGPRAGARTESPPGLRLRGGQIGADGKVNSPALDMWKLPDGSVLTDYCNLYVLPPLIDAGHGLASAKYSRPRGGG